MIPEKRLAADELGLLTQNNCRLTILSGSRFGSAIMRGPATTGSRASWSERSAKRRGRASRGSGSTSGKRWSFEKTRETERAERRAERQKLDYV